jgi:hypothetical protein
MSDPSCNICPNSMGVRALQTELALKYSGRGGYRPGAGRPRSGRHAVPHRSRQKVAPRHPVHVTLRVRDEVWNLRSRRCFRALARSFAAGKHRFGFRLAHFSVHAETDPYSSVGEHDKDWTGVDPPLVVEPRTWLLRVGWERGRATTRAA